MEGTKGIEFNPSCEEKVYHETMSEERIEPWKITVWIRLNLALRKVITKFHLTFFIFHLLFINIRMLF